MTAQWPFVGRTRELARVEELARTGVGAVLFGEPGAGKTALARELRRRAVAAGSAAGLVVGHAVSGRVPFEAFAGLNPAVGREFSGAEASDSAEVAHFGTLASVSRRAVLPREPAAASTETSASASASMSASVSAASASGFAAASASTSAPRSQSPSAEAAADPRLLRVADVAAAIPAALGARPGQRAVLVVDDAHLLDGSSARVLLHLAAGAGAGAGAGADADSAVTVVLTCPLGAPLPAGVQRLWRDGLCVRLEVPRLAAEDVSALLEAVLGGPVDQRAARAFARRSQGNALLLRELVGAALDSGALTRRAGVWTVGGELPVGGGARELVAARLNGVTGARRAALETIAAGEPLALPAAAALLGESVIEELEEARLVAVRDSLGRTEVGTAHPLYGEVIRAELPRLRLRRLRLALARALDGAPDPAPHDLVRAALWRLDSGETPVPAGSLVAAARAARAFSLETAERLARTAYEAGGSVEAALLLAEILVHSRRPAEAEVLLSALPPDSLTLDDREAIVYCTAVGRGLLLGDAGGGADLVAGVLAGESAASDRLHALYASLLAFDARFQDSLRLGLPLALDPGRDPFTRTFAAVGAVGAAYWLGRLDEAVATADALAPVAAGVRETVPFGLPALELITVCALAEAGDLDRAERRARRMNARAIEQEDAWAGPRSEYCLGRVAAARGLPVTALRLFRGCIAALTPFDHSFLRHISSCAARAAAAFGDVGAAEALLESAADAPRMLTYEPDFDLAEAAVLAARLHLAEAAERAAWVGGVAAARLQWNVAAAAFHDAARYGGADAVLGPLRDAVGRVDGPLVRCYLDHAAATAVRDPARLDAVAARFDALGAVLSAAEAASRAALAHAAAGSARAARASGQRAALLWARCEGAVSPWLAGAAVGAPLTHRERQVALLAAAGGSDQDIAAALGISPRTVQTHLAHVYDKLGARGRGELSELLR